jgi:tetratricopeptide (TPR) repeat protein
VKARSLTTKTKFDDFTCPLTKQIFLQPAMASPCGHIFERSAVKSRRKCPSCKHKIIVLVDLPFFKKEIEQRLQKEDPNVRLNQFLSEELLEELLAQKVDDYLFELIQIKNMQYVARCVAIKCREKKLDSACTIRSYDDLITEHPNYGRAHYYRGCLHLEKNNLKEAIADFDHSIKFNNKHVNAYIQRAVAKFKLDDFNGCIADCKIGLLLDQWSEQAYYHRARAYEAKKDYAHAMSDYLHLRRLATSSDLMNTAKNKIEELKVLTPIITEKSAMFFKKKKYVPIMKNNVTRGMASPK